MVSLVAVCILVLPALAGAMTADELFEDGNRLFRDDLYWAALLRYGQAAEAGMDSALLHYNTGVAHYRAGQHIRARESLEKAAASSRLRVLAHYNLGLNAHALGNMDEALDWFRLARDQEEKPKISRYAREAITRIRRAQQQADVLATRVEERREEQQRNFGDLSLYAQVGFASDDNVFRTPAEPYVDFSDPNQPLVVPEVQSGTYVPVRLGARYMINSLPYEGFYGAYRLAGRYYQDEELDNANEYRHELSFGNEYIRARDKRKREVYSAFKITQAEETYYDPDDGAVREIDGVDIGDRFNYLRYGPELRLRQSYGRLSVGTVFIGQLWDYEDVEAVPSYDHEYFRLGLHVQYRFTRTSLLRVNVEKSSRRYSDRPSFDLDGNQLITNPTLRYDYLVASLTARQRITRSMWFGFEYERTDREDRFVGYNDYVRDHYGFEFRWSPGRRFDLDLDAYYRNYNYPTAFAFNEPTQPSKTLETAQARLSASYRFMRSLSLVLHARLRDNVSNDLRIQYDRREFGLSLHWEP